MTQLIGTLRVAHLKKTREVLLKEYVGKSIACIPTPSLVIHADVFDLNKKVLEDIVQEMRKRRSEQEVIEPHPLRIRPHAKLHKSRVLAQRLLNGTNAHLYAGVCVQKVSEAEALSGMFDASHHQSNQTKEAIDFAVRNILITNGISTHQAATRVFALHRWMIEQNAHIRSDISNFFRLAVCVDSPAAVKMLADAMSSYERPILAPLPLYIEVNVGQNRGGAPPSSEYLIPLLEAIATYEGKFILDGLHAYHGGAQHIRDPVEREAVMAPAVSLAEHSKRIVERYLQESQAEPNTLTTVTGAGTGTFAVAEGLSPSVYNEIQPGSYVVMDCDYLRNYNMRGWLKQHNIQINLEGDDDQPLFRPAMYIKSSVVSKTSAGGANIARIVVDSGHKSSAIDSGLPCLAPWQSLELVGSHFPASSLLIECGNGGDDHGVFRADTLKLIPYNTANQKPLVDVDPQAVGESLVRALSIGDPVWLVPGHCDPTFNLHDYFFIVSGNTMTDATIVDIGMVDARGCQQ